MIIYPGTITRRMKSTMNNVYKDLLTQSDFESKISKLENSRQSQYPTVCAELCEMFEALGIKCEQGRDVEYYDTLFERERNNIPEFHDVEAKILKVMFENFESYPTPEDYMLRIVNRLSEREDGWGKDTLRLRILKQFIKYVDCFTYKGMAGKKVNVYCGAAYIKRYVSNKAGKTVKETDDILENIDDHVFDVLDTATKSQKKSDGTYGILKLADDLSKGIFKAGGATKRDLYMFAIAFDMTYSISNDETLTAYLFDYDSDIEKNLFEDYYTSNLMRFITRAYEGELSAFELDPSGRGINYKNFAEMVYIYYISKDLDPIDKLRGANEMIERLKLNKATQNKASQMDDTLSTQYYTSLFTDEILSLDEAEFEKFVSENFDCNVHDESLDYTDNNGEKHEGKKSALQIQTAQKTAFRIYTDLIKKMETDNPALLRENCNYGLWFTDVSVFSKYGTDGIKQILDRADNQQNASKNVDKFIKLLLSINMFLGHLFEEKKSDLNVAQQHCALSKRIIKKMSIDKAEDMTRTALIVAYYYRYNQINEVRGTEKSFIEVLDDYTDSTIGLNSMLEAAGYQPVNDRNIFDLAVVFSSYAYLSM